MQKRDTCPMRPHSGQSYKSEPRKPLTGKEHIKIYESLQEVGVPAASKGKSLLPYVDSALIEPTNICLGRH